MSRSIHALINTDKGRLDPANSVCPAKDKEIDEMVRGTLCVCQSVKHNVLYIIMYCSQGILLTKAVDHLKL